MEDYTGIIKFAIQLIGLISVIFCSLLFALLAGDFITYILFKGKASKKETQYNEYIIGVLFLYFLFLGIKRIAWIFL